MAFLMCTGLVALIGGIATRLIAGCTRAEAERVVKEAEMLRDQQIRQTEQTLFALGKDRCSAMRDTLSAFRDVMIRLKNVESAPINCGWMRRLYGSIVVARVYLPSTSEDGDLLVLLRVELVQGYLRDGLHML